MALRRKHHQDLKENEIGIIGIAFDKNSSFMRGPAKAPQAIIEGIESDSANYFTENLTDLNEHPRVYWCGNIPFTSYLNITTHVRELLKTGAIPFTLGGDHSIAYPIMLAMAEKHPKLTILQFDAHGDLYDELDGNRFSHACPFARIMEEGLAQNLTQVGIRTMTLHQKEQAERFEVRVIQMKDWQPGQSLDIEGPVYLTFDMDVLDPAFAPGVSHHEPGGFSTREVLHILQGLNIDLVGCDVVEYNPDRDVHGVTSMVAAKIVKELLAKLL